MIIAGPPWWSAGHLLAIAVALLLLVVLANFVYHRVEAGVCGRCSKKASAWQI